MPRQKPFRNLKPDLPTVLAHPATAGAPGREEPGFEASCRLRPEDAARVAARARELGLAQSALIGGLVQAALDAVDEGLLRFDVEIVETVRTDRRGRRLRRALRYARPGWTDADSHKAGDRSQPAGTGPGARGAEMRSLFGGARKLYPEPEA